MRRWERYWQKKLKKYLIGLDNGGTSVKAAVFDLDGRLLAKAGQFTENITPKPGYVERDMEKLWRANCSCVKTAVEKSGVSPGDVAGIAVCGHGKGLYGWGRNEEPAYHGISSTDGRAWKYPLKWKEEEVWQEIYPQICQELMACQQVSLLAWLKEHEPKVYEDIRWVFSVKDYIRYRLTGEAYSEMTDVSGSGLMDIRRAEFDEEMLGKLGIGEVYGKLAPVRCSCDLCGTLTAKAAALTGLMEGTPVAGGMFDIDACAIASDIVSPDNICTIAGTWSINEYISRTPVTDGSAAMNSLYAIPGYYLIEECSATSSGNLEWFAGQCMRDLVSEKDGAVYSAVNKMVSDIRADECEVYFLPFLYGSNAHPLGKGSFVGLTTYHTRAHLLRAVFEGVAYSHKKHIDRLLASRDTPKAVRMAGGAVKSRVWVQMFADVLGMPVETVEADELGALGCAMAAAVAAGIYADYTEAARNMVHINEKILPFSGHTAIYEKKYQNYLAIQDALDGIWDRFEV